jgi:NAD(P)-dependent dehydrogenase (short-subunit alcohol dehydrogenase family)
MREDDSTASVPVGGGRGRGDGLDGRVAIVTGAGSKGGGVGTGKAIAVQLGREGASVLLVDRHDDRANETREWIEREGGKAAVLVVDLAEPSAPRRIADEAVAQFGRIDVLVNNAAVYPPPNFLETTRAELQAVIDVNLVAPFMLTQAVLPAMIEAGGGSVVFISSILAMRGPSQAPYAATKAALMGLTTSLTSLYGPQGVRFNTVAPGMVDTPVRRELLARSGIDPNVRSQFTATSLNVQGDAWDVAKTTVFLVSDDARYLTGLLVPVDGGSTTRLGA